MGNLRDNIDFFYKKDKKIVREKVSYSYNDRVQVSLEYQHIFSIRDIRSTKSLPFGRSITVPDSPW